MWAFSDPPLPPLSHLNGFLTQVLKLSVTNVLTPPPTCMTSFMNGPDSYSLDVLTVVEEYDS